MTDQELDSLLDIWPAPEPPASLRRSVLAAFPRLARRKILGVPMRWAAAFVLGAVGVGLGATVWSYEPVIARGRSRLPGGTHLRYTTLAQPPASIVKFYLLGSGSVSRDGWQQRYLWDRAEQVYFGYEMRVEPLADEQYRVEMRPLSGAIGLVASGGIGHYHQAPVPPLPASRVVRANVPFEVDLLAGNGERVYDVIQLSPTRLPDGPAAQPPDPQSTRMRLSLPRLHRNGGFVAEGHIDAAGPTVWFYLPGQGRWLVALAQAGNFRFRQAGYVEGNTIKFQWGSDEFRIESREPVASGGVRPVFVHHQPDFRISPNHPKANEPMFGSAGAPVFHYFTPRD